MKEKIKKLIWIVLKILRTGPLMLFIHPKSALLKAGWFRSFHTGKVVDRNGNPIPWWTYSFIDFIEERLSKSFNVLEFGAGASTIWLNERVNEVISVENDPFWADKMQKKSLSKSRIFYLRNSGEIHNQSYILGKEYDIIIIDNQGNRMDCAVSSLPLLKPEGVVIWDNTEGADWPEIKKFFIQKGFSEISFSGMTPQILSYNRTTIFYRPGNCIKI